MAQTYMFLSTAVSAYEKQYIREALVACNWNKPIAAKRLGIGQSTLYRKITEHKIKRKS